MIKKMCLVFCSLVVIMCFNKVNAQCNHAVVGYWQSWSGSNPPDNTLGKVSCAYNVIDVAFLSNVSPTDPTMSFPLDTLGLESSTQFIADVKALQKRGVTVIASIGGANATITIPDATALNNFVNSLEGLINRYGFNGIDLDIENGITLNSVDNDYTNPTTPTIVNLITAMKTLKTKYGSNFYITMAPQTANVQGGISSYSGIWGCYLPIIYGLGSELNYVYTQYYNTGSCTANDGKNYNEGTADFITSMTDMLLSGFTMANNQKFAALSQTQVAFGLPATTGAASGGYTVFDTVKKALNYLMNGTSFGGKYKLSSTYPNLGGIMTWSTNWDSSGHYAFAKTFAQYFCSTTDFCTNVTGVNNIAKPKESGIYPNPATDNIYFQSVSKFETVEIYNMTGALVYSTKNFNGNTINISTLSAGVYCLRALGKDAVVQQTFIKK